MTEPEFPQDGIKKRYEILLLEDDQEQRTQIHHNLTANGIIVHSCSSGEDALDTLTANPQIGLLMTDIELLDSKGRRSGFQGYDVANQIPERFPNYLLSVLVMTALPKSAALREANYFRIRIHTMAKEDLLEMPPNDEQNYVVREIRTLIEATSNSWIDAIRKSYAKSRWLRKYSNTSYWQLYQGMWYNKNWESVNIAVGERAKRIVESYRSGDIRKLRGGFLHFKEEPQGEDIKEILVGRRVIYAMKYDEPAYWKTFVRGEQSINEEEPIIPPEIYSSIRCEETKQIINQIQEKAPGVYEIKKEIDKLSSELDAIENNERTNSEPRVNKELHIKQEQRSKLHERLLSIRNIIRPSREQLEQQLQNESEEIQRGFLPYLRFWGTEFENVDWANTKQQSKGGSDPVTQDLLILGIREEDINAENYLEWKLLLPEEMSWMNKITGVLPI